MSEAARRTPEHERQIVTPSAYFASLSDYAHMVLHGVWIEDLTDPEHVQEEIEKMLAASEEAVAEEWALHDYEGFGDWSPSEHEPIENLSRVAAGIEEHGPAFASWVDYLGDVDDERVDDFAEAFRGCWESMEAFAESMIEDHGLNIYEGLPDWIASYVRIDLEMLGRDMAMDMHVTPDGSGGVWVFDPNI